MCSAGDQLDSGSRAQKTIAVSCVCGTRPAYLSDQFKQFQFMIPWYRRRLRNELVDWFMFRYQTSARDVSMCRVVGLLNGLQPCLCLFPGTYRGQWLQSTRHGFGIRQSSVYGLAVRYRHKTMSSKSSMMTSSSDHEDSATLRRRDEKLDNERGGFVLLGRLAQRTTTEGSSEGRLRRTLARLKKQRSTSDISPGSHSGLSRMSPGPSRHRTPDGLARNQRASSEEWEDHNESIHTDSCNASFISQVIIIIIIIIIIIVININITI